MSAAQNLKAIVESFSDLLEGHIKLFKLELAEDAKVIGVEVGKIVALLPLIFVGYAFMCAALAMFLQRWLAADLSYLTVGLLNLAGGGLGIALAAKKLSKKQLLDGTRAEVSTTAQTLARAVKDPAITVEVTNG
ncbi:MAG: phage holin family protein [Myxococcaceae bacterium]|nr:phage holin family protein [Myxococcaceae bacterium]